MQRLSCRKLSRTHPEKQQQPNHAVRGMAPKKQEETLRLPLDDVQR